MEINNAPYLETGNDGKINIHVNRQQDLKFKIENLSKNINLISSKIESNWIYDGDSNIIKVKRKELDVNTMECRVFVDKILSESFSKEMDKYTSLFNFLMNYTNCLVDKMLEMIENYSSEVWHQDFCFSVLRHYMTLGFVVAQLKFFCDYTFEMFDINNVNTSFNGAAKNFWRKKFGSKLFVTIYEFMNALINEFPSDDFSKDDAFILLQSLDVTRDGYISLYDYYVFVNMFGNVEVNVMVMKIIYLTQTNMYHMSNNEYELKKRFNILINEHQNRFEYEKTNHMHQVSREKKLGVVIDENQLSNEVEYYRKYLAINQYYALRMKTVVSLSGNDGNTIVLTFIDHKSNQRENLKSRFTFLNDDPIESEIIYDYSVLQGVLNHKMISENRKINCNFFKPKWTNVPKDEFRDVVTTKPFYSHIKYDKSLDYNCDAVVVQYLYQQYFDNIGVSLVNDILEGNMNELKKRKK